MIGLLFVWAIFISSNLYSSTISILFSSFFSEFLSSSSLPQTPLQIELKQNINANRVNKKSKELGIPRTEENIICTKTIFFVFASKLSKIVSIIPQMALSKFNNKEESKILLLLKAPNPANNWNSTILKVDYI